MKNTEIIMALAKGDTIDRKDMPTNITYIRIIEWGLKDMRNNCTSSLKQIRALIKDLEEHSKVYTVAKISDNGTHFPKPLEIGLKPMTHKEACTFKSKMMVPSDWMLVEVSPQVD